jgi:pimeloyl-ACP methyl ester carboxylesterase
VDVWTDGLAALLEMDLRHAIEHVRVPALVIVGDLDRLTPPASARKLAQALPQGELVVLEGAGHMAPMERYTQFNRVLERFTKKAFSREAVGTGVSPAHERRGRSSHPAAGR